MPVTNLLSLSSKSTLHCLLYENRDGPCNISALQLAQCLAMMEKGAGGMLKKEGLSFLVSGFTPPFAPASRLPEHLWVHSGVLWSSVALCGQVPIKFQKYSHGQYSHQVLESQCLTSSFGILHPGRVFLLAQWLRTASGWAHNHTFYSEVWIPAAERRGHTSKFVSSMRTLLQPCNIL